MQVALASFSNSPPAFKQFRKSQTTRTVAMASGTSQRASSQPRSSCSSPGVPLAAEELARSSIGWQSILQTQREVIEHLTTHLGLHPATDEPLTLSSVEGNVGISTYACGEPLYGGASDDNSNKPPVRWMSAAILVNSAMSFGSTRLMAFTDSSVDVPHYVLELALIGPQKIQGTLSLAQRSDLVLDLEYLDKYYNKSAVVVGDDVENHQGREEGQELKSFNKIFNECLARQESHRWVHYTTPQCDMKPYIANAISYSFKEDSAFAFGVAAVDVAKLWTHHILAAAAAAQATASTGNAFDGAKNNATQNNIMIAKYDARHADVVRTDPGNIIAVKLFGEEATEKMIEATLGPGM